MKFALWHPMPWPHYPAESKSWPYDNRHCDPQETARLFDEYLAEISLADALGFDWIMVGEEHMTPYGLVPNAAAIACAVARSTTRAKVVVAGNPIGFLNPLRVAEEYALVDVLSGGRLVAGFIQGTSQTALAYHHDMAELWPRYVEGTELVLRAFAAEEPFTHQGEHYAFGPASLWPRPLQTRPPIVVPATSQRAARFAARHRAVAAIARLKSLDALTKWTACTQAYTDAAHQAGWQPSPENFMVATHAAVAPTRSAAEEQLAHGEEYVYGALSGAVTQRDTAPGGAQATASGPTTEERLKAGTVIAAEPADLGQQVAGLAEATGAGVLAVNFKVGRIPHEDVLRSIELFAATLFPTAAATATATEHRETHR